MVKPVYNNKQNEKEKEKEKDKEYLSKKDQSQTLKDKK